MNALTRFIPLLLLLACSSGEERSPKNSIAKGEYIYRLHDEYFFTALPPEKQPLPIYPWEQGQIGSLPKITKEYFRCKGSSLNVVHTALQKNETVRIADCGGSERHSLPLREGKEYIYPILLDLLNYLQAKTGKRVIITSGHRCPKHNTYIDPSPANQHSKHLLGAEVSFYILGLEDRADSIVKLLQAYYQEKPKYNGSKDYLDFQRYDKGDTDVATPPWYNKEIYIKLYQKKEGRDFDNRHPYPYISVQVRYDWDLQERVQVTWDKAFKNYLRK